MDIGSIFLILSMIIIVGVVLSRPFQTRTGSNPLVAQPQDSTAPERSALMANRDQVLDALQELDFDHALGKIPEDVYQSQRAELAHQGAHVLRQLDQTAPEGSDPAGTLLEDAIRRRPDDPAQAIHPEDEALENLVAARRRARQSKATGFCPKCGKPAQLKDQYCSRCGGKLERTA